MLIKNFIIVYFLFLINNLFLLLFSSNSFIQKAKDLFKYINF